MPESIDPKSLRVVDLREELGKRNLAKTGKKDELVARLEEAMAKEASTETTESQPEETEATVETTEPQPETTVETKTTEHVEPTQPIVPSPVNNDAEKVAVESPVIEPTSVETKVSETIEPSTIDSTMEQQEIDQTVLKRKREESPVEVQEEKRVKPAELTKETEDTNEKEPLSTTTSVDTLAICIKGFVRPLITKSLHEFISQFGNIKRFWIDPIKTHCYVIYDTLEQANDAFDKINGTVYPPSTGKTVTVIRLTSDQATKLMDREQEIADKRGRANWEKLLENVLNNIDIDESSETKQSPSSPPNKQRRLGGLEQITRQLQQRSAVSAVMDQEHQPQTSILDRLSNSAQITKEDFTALPKVGKSLDDLFLKTKTSPGLYYLPVDKDIAAQRLTSMQSK